MQDPFAFARPRHTEQLSIRLTEQQRTYVREQIKKLQHDPSTSGFKWSEADVIRMMIERNLRANLDLTKGA